MMQAEDFPQCTHEADAANEDDAQPAFGVVTHLVEAGSGATPVHPPTPSPLAIPPHPTMAGQLQGLDLFPGDRDPEPPRRAAAGAPFGAACAGGGEADADRKEADGEEAQGYPRARSSVGGNFRRVVGGNVHGDGGRGGGDGDDGASEGPASSSSPLGGYGTVFDVGGGKVRKGKWTPEEERYTAAMINNFNLGLLPLAPGTTLRTHLSEKLNCDPMRITKKFAGDASIGKQVFSPAYPSPDLAATMARAQDRLEELEALFLRKIGDHRPRSRSRKSLAAATVAGGDLYPGSGGVGSGFGSNGLRGTAAARLRATLASANVFNLGQQSQGAHSGMLHHASVGGGGRLSGGPRSYSTSSGHGGRGSRGGREGGGRGRGRASPESPGNPYRRQFFGSSFRGRYSVDDVDDDDDDDDDNGDDDDDDDDNGDDDNVDDDNGGGDGGEDTDEGIGKDGHVGGHEDVEGGPGRRSVRRRRAGLARGSPPWGGPSSGLAPFTRGTGSPADSHAVAQAVTPSGVAAAASLAALFSGGSALAMPVLPSLSLGDAPEAAASTQLGAANAAALLVAASEGGGGGGGSGDEGGQTRARTDEWRSIGSPLRGGSLSADGTVAALPLTHPAAAGRSDNPLSPRSQMSADATTMAPVPSEASSSHALREGGSPLVEAQVQPAALPASPLGHAETEAHAEAARAAAAGLLLGFWGSAAAPSPRCAHSLPQQSAPSHPHSSSECFAEGTSPAPPVAEPPPRETPRERSSGSPSPASGAAPVTAPSRGRGRPKGSTSSPRPGSGGGHRSESTPCEAVLASASAAAAAAGAAAVAASAPRAAQPLSPRLVAGERVEVDATGRGDWVVATVRKRVESCVRSHKPKPREPTDPAAGQAVAVAVEGLAAEGLAAEAGARSPTAVGGGGVKVQCGDGAFVVVPDSEERARLRRVAECGETGDCGGGDEGGSDGVVAGGAAGRGQRRKRPSDRAASAGDATVDDWGQALAMAPATSAAAGRGVSSPPSPPGDLPPKRPRAMGVGRGSWC